MRHIISLSALVSLACLPACFADQAQWNSREVCEDAVAMFKPGSVVISYCSVCDSEYAEVWKVKEAVVAVTGDKDKKFFEVRIFGKRLYKSRNAFKSGEYQEPVEYFEAKDDAQSGWLFRPVDLAYLYINKEGNSFQCIGKALGLELEILVFAMKLPNEFMPKLKKK